MAETQGITLNAGEYVIVVLLATLSSIATTPIPSSSLVLTVIICQAVGVPITGSKFLFQPTPLLVPPLPFF